MGVTVVVRGRDLLLSSPQQIYLAGQLGFRSPRFIHHPLLCNEAGQRLSKRDRSLDMAALRERYAPEDIVGMLARAAGLQATDAPITAADLLSAFSWKKIGTADLTF